MVPLPLFKRERDDIGALIFVLKSANNEVIFVLHEINMVRPVGCFELNGLGLRQERCRLKMEITYFSVNEELCYNSWPLPDKNLPVLLVQSNLVLFGLKGFFGFVFIFYFF